MLRSTLLLCGWLILALALQGEQRSVPTPNEAEFVLRHFRFNSGEELPELRMHYYTFGRPDRDAAGRVTNAVLILHGTGGSAQTFFRPIFAGVLFGPGQLLDSSRYFISFRTTLATANPVSQAMASTPISRNTITMT